MTSLLNQTIGKYRFEQLLGEGAMGAVYLAHHLVLSRPVAIKVMQPHYARRPDFRERFLREAQVAARLDHPGIVKVHDFEESPDFLYIVMEFIPGDNVARTLQSLQQQGQWFPLADAVQLIWQVSEALDYAHRKHVLHRDIKPANIMLKLINSRSERFQAIVTDLGLAKLTEGDDLSRTNVALGTPAYMSPEQAQGQAIDARSDIYSLGVLLYELAVGQRPFPIRHITEAIRYHVHEAPPPPRTLRPDLPPTLEALILRTLAKDPAQRFQSAGRLAQALTTIPLSSLPTTIPPNASAGPTSLYTQIQQSIVSQQTVFNWSGVFAPSPGPGVDQIQIVTPDGATRVAPITGRSLTVGREPNNDLALNDSKLSRQHLRITFDGVHYQVTDLNSTNGTRLDNSPLSPNVATRWQVGQVLQVGKHQLRLQRAPAGAKTERLSRPPRNTNQSHTTLPPATTPSPAGAGGATPPGLMLVGGQGNQRARLPWGGTALVTLLLVIAAVGFWQLLSSPQPTASAPEGGQPVTLTATPTSPPTSATATSAPGAVAIAPTDTPTPAPTATASATPLPTVTSTTPPSMTPTPLPTETATPLPTATATVTPVPTATETATPPPTATPTVPPTATPTVPPLPPPAMLGIPAGDFRMGSDDAGLDAHVADCNASEGVVKGLTCQRDWFGDEAPQRTIFVNAFQITQYEITNAQYQACIDQGVCAQRHIDVRSDIPDNLANFDGANRPVIGVSAYDAQNYCGFIGARLPTEEEWEKAARGTDARAYPWGNSFDGARANICDANCSLPAIRFTGVNDGFARTAPVGSFPGGASPYGVQDMAGNVWEWTSSYHSDGQRIIRGGGWSKWFHQSRTAERTQVPSDYANFDIGIRCVK